MSPGVGDGAGGGGQRLFLAGCPHLSPEPWHGLGGGGDQQPPPGHGAIPVLGDGGRDWIPGAAKAGDPLSLPGVPAPPTPALTEGPSPESEEADGLASVKLVSTVEL